MSNPIQHFDPEDAKQVGLQYAVVLSVARRLVEDWTGPGPVEVTQADLQRLVPYWAPERVTAMLLNLANMGKLTVERSENGSLLIHAVVREVASECANKTYLLKYPDQERAYLPDRRATGTGTRQISSSPRTRVRTRTRAPAHEGPGFRRTRPPAQAPAPMELKPPTQWELRQMLSTFPVTHRNNEKFRRAWEHWVTMDQTVPLVGGELQEFLERLKNLPPATASLVLEHVILPTSTEAKVAAAIADGFVLQVRRHISKNEAGSMLIVARDLIDEFSRLPGSVTQISSLKWMIRSPELLASRYLEWFRGQYRSWTTVPIQALRPGGKVWSQFMVHIKGLAGGDM